MKEFRVVTPLLSAKSAESGQRTAVVLQQALHIGRLGYLTVQSASMATLEIIPRERQAANGIDPDTTQSTIRDGGRPQIPHVRHSHFLTLQRPHSIRPAQPSLTQKPSRNGVPDGTAHFTDFNARFDLQLYSTRLQIGEMQLLPK